jgi:hypothetical protein
MRALQAAGMKLFLLDNSAAHERGAQIGARPARRVFARY